MSASPNKGSPFSGLMEIPVEQVRPNEKNPRLIFPEEELDRLAQSIAHEGILVPIVVYANNDDTYTLIDGERRYRCSVTLGFDTVPALITSKDSDVENLLKMFNIHQMREPWRDIPTALALEQLAVAIEKETKNEASNSDLSERSGLSVERVRRLRYAMTLPNEYQQYINDGTIPLNWFWELHQNVILPLAKGREKLHDEYGDNEVRDAFVAKRLDGVITDTVSLRRVRPIIKYAADDAERSTDDTSVLDDTIRRLIDDKELTIATAYEDTVQIMVEVDKLKRSTSNMITGFERLFAQATGTTEQKMVLSIALELQAEIDRVVEENS